MLLPSLEDPLAALVMASVVVGLGSDLEDVAGEILAGAVALPALDARVVLGKQLDGHTTEALLALPLGTQKFPRLLELHRDA